MPSPTDTSTVYKDTLLKLRSRKTAQLSTLDLNEHPDDLASQEEDEEKAVIERVKATFKLVSIDLDTDQKFPIEVDLAGHEVTVYIFEYPLSLSKLIALQNKVGGDIQISSSTNDGLKLFFRFS